MSKQHKFFFLVLWPIAAIIIYLIGGNITNDATDEFKEMIASSRSWLLIYAVLFIVNYVLAWLYSASWAVTLGRSLIWAVLAYLTISDLIDLIGNNYPLILRMFNLSGLANDLANSSPESLTENLALSNIRYLLVVLANCLVMSIICIAIGFESRTDNNNDTDSAVDTH